MHLPPLSAKVPYYSARVSAKPSEPAPRQVRARQASTYRSAVSHNFAKANPGLAHQPGQVA
jgi:hypothetical protein